MRVTDYQRNQLYSRHIQDRISNLTRIQEEIGLGRSLFAPSENVHLADQALRAQTELASNSQYLRNVDDASAWIDGADSNLQSILDLLNSIDTLAIAANNSSQTADDRRNTALQIDNKLEELMGLVNATQGDRALFGGHSTTGSPFTATRDASGRIQGATANSDTIIGRIYRTIGMDENVQVNVPGSTLFQPVGEEGTDSDLFYVIASLRNTIANNNTPPVGEEDMLSNDHLREQLDQIRSRVVDQQTYLGSVGQRLNQTKSRLKDREIQITDQMEKAQGVDLVALTGRLANEESAYNALASLGSQLLKQTLVDYLR
jgi:flagellar hook-associated protein 3 FlgL